MPLPVAHPLWSILLTLVSFSVAGCGPAGTKTWPVTGQVVFSDGKPVMLGTVEFLSPDEKLNATGTIRPDGTFVLGTFTDSDGACEGEHSVIVTQLIISEGLQKHQQDHGRPVHLLYGNYVTSPLKAKVEPLPSNTVKLVVEPAAAER